jgi:hypothetical protein
MYQGLDDNIGNQTRSNDLLNGNEQIDISKSNLLPSLQFVVLEETQHSNTIIKHDRIDLQELKKYI